MPELSRRQAEKLLAVLRETSRDDGELLVPGAILADRFRVIDTLAPTRQSRLAGAIDLATRDEVVIKTPNAGDAPTRARFAREARLLAEIAHPRIVRFVAQGTASGAPYLVTERLAGETLAAALARGRPIDGAGAIALVAAIAEPLAHLHERGLVHRDVTTSNVFLAGGRFDDPVLIDLGFARASDDFDEITDVGIVLGTPPFVAPEVEAGARADTRSDVFGLGKVLERLVGVLRTDDPFAAPLRELAVELTRLDPAARLPDAISLRHRIAALAEDSRLQDEEWTLIARALASATDEGERSDLAGFGLAWLESAGERQSLVARQLGLLRVASARTLSADNDDAAALARIRALLPAEPDRTELGTLRLLEAQAAAWRGAFREAMPLAEDAARLLPEGSGVWYRAIADVALSAPRLGATDRIAWAHEVFERALEPRAPRSVALGAARTAIALYTMKWVEAGDRLSAQLESVVGVTGRSDPLVAARITRVRATRALAHGELEAYVDSLEEAIRSLEVAGDVRNAWLDRANLGFALVEIGDAEAAIALLPRVIERTAAGRLAHGAALARKNLALAHFERGKLEPAEKLATHAARNAREQGNPRLESVALALLARIERARKKDVAAETAARAVERSPTEVERARALGALVEALVARGSDAIAQAELALECLRRAGEIDGGEAAVYDAIARALEAREPERARTVRGEGIARLEERAGRFKSAERKARFLARPDHVRLRAHS